MLLSSLLVSVARKLTAHQFKHLHQSASPVAAQISASARNDFCDGSGASRVITFLKGRLDLAVQIDLFRRQLMRALNPVFVTAAIYIKNFADQRGRVTLFDFVD